jgi:hypothetical protein
MARASAGVMVTQVEDVNLFERKNAGLLRLRTLVRLRWLAVVGQLGAVLFVQYWLGFKLPLAPEFSSRWIVAGL